MLQLIQSLVLSHQQLNHKKGAYMTLREEMDKATEQGVELIAPYKLNEMSKVANKIVNLLLSNGSAVTFGYSDMRIIMRIVEKTLDESIQTKESEQ